MQAVPGPGGGRAVAESMRDRILDATERLLGRLGYRKTTMDDIAAEAGVGRRTIYLHFPGKEEVALATIDRIVERLREAAPGPASSMTTGSWSTPSTVTAPSATSAASPA